MGRTPQEIFEQHVVALDAGDLDAIMADYGDDARVVTTDVAVQGTAAIREFFTAALGALPDIRFTAGSAVYAGDALLVTWSATSPTGTISDAVDTFVFADDRIRLHTTAFRVEPADPS